MPDPYTAITGLRLAGVAVRTAGDLAHTPHGWIARAVGAALDGAAEVLSAGDDWQRQRAAAVPAVRDVLVCLPGMERADALHIARGALAVVAWVREVTRG